MHIFGETGIAVPTPNFQPADAGFVALGYDGGSRVNVQTRPNEKDIVSQFSVGSAMQASC